MDNLLFVLASLGLWCLVMNFLRDIGFSWRTLYLLAGVWGVGAVTFWFNSQ